MTGQKDQIQAATSFIQEKTAQFEPEIAMILGSGMGMLAEEVENAIVLKYGEIPGFPASTVKGHAGRLVFGTLQGRSVMVMQGRFHYYEGHAISVLAFPIRVMHALGCRMMLVTNAAGAANPDFTPGDLMIITDHLNFAFNNPLMGPNDPETGPRFPDTSTAYSPRLQDVARATASAQGVQMQEGVYQFMTGPSYETPAEVQMARFLGADAVGMSTVPEVHTAVHCGIEVLGISYISNLGAGISDKALSHSEVVETMETIKDKFIRLVRGIVADM
ncbi:MAG: purine-nucleoside phosphorylase [Bacteroidota bacterium]